MKWGIHRQGHWLTSSGWRVGAEAATKHDTEEAAQKALDELRAQSPHGLHGADVWPIR